jgi:hypothetical protein
MRISDWRAPRGNQKQNHENDVIFRRPQNTLISGNIKQ